MKNKERREEAVSPVIGEMLMLSLVLILASLFAVSASQYIPQDREPSLNVMIGESSDNHNITLWHKGGDTISKRDIKVIFSNETKRLTEYYGNITINNDTSSMNFMPGDYMEVSTTADIRGYTVQMVVSKSVIFFGRVED
ncbi:MAG: type IV pilin N-terminal domain-containing protein [Methanomicrobiaceae archaeon]|nr:type IV pilin N-terminal domain-containing protein [Methanomicrobiaceae archaeon]